MEASSETQPEPSPDTADEKPDPQAAGGQAQKHGNAQVGVCAGGNLLPTPGFTLP
jgi:hypothetical protein